jgi:hypothetical protein
VKTWSAIEQRRGQQEEQRLLFLFEDQLRCWTEGELSKLRGRGRSIALPPGTLSFRAIAARLLVVDEAKVFSWARTSCPAAVVVTEKLLKTPIMRHFEESGELPPGCDIAPAETAFYIR